MIKIGFRLDASRWITALVWAVVICAAMLFAQPAFAQSVYVNSTDGAINGTTTCAAPLVRNFTVSDSFVITDVDLGFFATHSWRGDIRLTLQSPTGTRVQLVNGDPNNTSGDNLNVRLNDSGTQLVNTDNATAAHSTAAPPPFANNFIPNASLSAFNGQNSAGTWRLEICDVFTGADDGTFRHAELYLTGPSADLSLSKTLLTPNPTQGSTATYRLTVTNASGSSTTASGIQVQDYLPTGFTFTSATTVAFNGTTGIWNVGTLSPGQSSTVDISGTVTASSGATITNLAEIIASSVADPDSVPNNGSTTEDDYDSVSFTVQGTRVAGVPPTLVCPNGVISFDWAGRSWPQGSTANNYTLTGLGAFNWSISSPAGFMNIASLGGQHPVLTTAAQNQTTLSKAIDFNNRTEFATTTITLGEAVDGAQFTIFDVDFAANDFADRVLVRGLYQGNTVIPVLTNGVSNYVIGNQAFGDQGAAATSADGNVTATFNQPVDTIIIEYGNHSTAPADPDGQAIQMKGDIAICTPDAQLTVVKTSSLLSDPVNGTTDPKAIPGALVRYCILVTNTGSASARLVSAQDVLPADVTYVTASIQSGATCGTASTAEDDDNIGGDETDPWGASFDTGTVTFLADEIDANSTAAVIFHATIN